MPSRHQSASHQRNRATGFTDADWGALEKRLSDTRDLLKDILLHLRKVLDNLKTAGTHYQSAGRAWRKPGAYAQGAGRQQWHRPEGPAAGASKASGASGSSRQSSDFKHSSPSSGQTGSTGSSSAGSSRFAGAAGAAGSATAASSFRASTASGAGASGAQGASSRASAAGANFGSQKTAGPSSRASYERQAGNGFSWSQRGKAEPGQDQAGAKSTWRASSANSGDKAGERATFTGGQRPGSQAGAQAGGQSSGASGSWKREQDRAREERQEHRHRTTGPGGGSSYQDYSKRNHKSPLGSGRMTLTQACALLCVSYPCSADDVRVAYRKQARRHHPDLGGDEEMMKTINQAYELALSWCAPLRAKPGSPWAA